jgi:hypothetical protein
MHSAGIFSHIFLVFSLQILQLKARLKLTFNNKLSIINVFHWFVAGCAREVLHEDHLFGGTSLHHRHYWTFQLITLFKKVSDFSITSRHVTNLTLPGGE